MYQKLFPLNNHIYNYTKCDQQIYVKSSGLLIKILQNTKKLFFIYSNIECTTRLENEQKLRYQKREI